MPSPCANASKIRCCCSAVDADAGVGDRERHDRRGARRATRVAGLHPLVGQADLHADLAVLGELERVGEQVLQDLAQALRVGDDASRAVRSRARPSSRGPCPSATCSNSRIEAAAQLVRAAASLISTRDGPRLDLGQVEDAVEQLSSSLPEAVDDARVLAPASSVMLSSGLSSSCWARISRLFSGVRSSCDMLAMNSDLYFDETASCPAFSSTSRFDSLDLLVLVLGLDVLLGEQPRLAAEVLVGLAQLLLLRAELFGLRLRLLRAGSR